MEQLKCLRIMKTWKKYLMYIIVKIHQPLSAHLCEILKDIYVFI